MKKKLLLALCGAAVACIALLGRAPRRMENQQPQAAGWTGEPEEPKSTFDPEQRRHEREVRELEDEITHAGRIWRYSRLQEDERMFLEGCRYIDTTLIP